MFTSRLKIATTALVLVAAFVVGAGALLYTAQAAKALGDASSSAGSGQEVKAPAAKGTGPGRLLLVRNSDFVALNPDGKEEHQWPNHGKTLVQARAQGYRLPGRLSPDGSRAACVVMASEQRKRGDSPEGWRFKVVIRNLGAGEEKAVDFTGRGLWIQCWRPDGKRLVVWHWMDDGQARHILVDPYSGKTEPLDLPAGMLVLDWARDDTFLVSYDNYAKDQQSKSWLGMLEKGSKEARLLTTRARMRNLDARLSPDGKWVLFTDARRSPDGKVLFTDAFAEDRSRQPYILDVLTGKRQPLADFPEHAEAQGVAWSPDGKRVAYTWWQLHPDLLKKWDLLDDNDRARPTEAFLVVADADGRNAKVIASQCTNRISEPTFGSVDWR